ncbi:DNA primase [Rhodococcus opacus]|uniref:DNA primase n=1 Tax=Rhodococcus opacus TaxID=37919 RepID=A0AAX3YSW1_RHOOP|nr:DNA primase [Rhodococcus opacus]MCZ4589624.1 DNA primase [Rhodococcus opacus]WLF51217.1 DNA primase [Rhodococcus opacus]
MRIPDHTLDQIRQRATIDEIAARYTRLAPASRGESKGCCPLPDHDERTPSFYVNPATGVFHCFGCSRGGDVITFLELVEQLTFREAVEQLAGQVEVAIPTEPEEIRRASGTGTPKLLRTALQIAADVYATTLTDDPGAEAARRYLTDRAFNDDHIRAWGIGYAPRTHTTLLGPHLATLRLPTTAGYDAGLIRQGRTGQPYDTFAGRLIWPLHDPQGRIIGLAGRSLDDPSINPDRYRKYINSDDSALFRKSDTLFGLCAARPAIVKQRRVIVVEGYTDVMAVAAAGHPEVVGVCGTAFTAAHARLLSKLLGPDGEIVVMLDADDAGQAAAWKIAVACHQFATVTLAVPGERGSDPCQLRADDGDQAVRDTVNARRPLIRETLRHLLADAGTPEKAAVAARRAAALLDELTDEVLVLRYRRWLASELGIPEGQLRVHTPAAASPPPEVTPIEHLDCIRDLAAQLVDDPTLWNRLRLPDVLEPADLLPDRYCAVVARAAAAPADTSDRWAWLLSTASDDAARAAVTALRAGAPARREPMKAVSECARAYGPARLAAVRSAAGDPASVGRFARLAAGLSRVMR